MSESESNKANIELIVYKMDEMAKNFEAINKKLDTFVTKEEFSPVRSIVYGIVTVTLVSFMGALVALVIKK